MPRPQNIKNRELILDSALGLIHEHGFKGVSMDDVAEKAGMKKANLFHYYPTKDELGLAVLERAARSHEERILRQLAGHEDPIKTVEAMFLKPAAELSVGGCAKGCFIGNLAQEISAEKERMRLRIAELLGFWTEQLARFLERHKAQGYFKKAMASKEAAQALVSLFEGATLLCKAEKNPEPLRHAGVMAATYLRALKA